MTKVSKKALIADVASGSSSKKARSGGDSLHVQKAKGNVKSKSGKSKGGDVINSSSSGGGEECGGGGGGGVVVYPERKPLPKRDSSTRELLFQDFPKFRPNMTPKEVLQAGSFGGTYFRPIRSAVTKKIYGDEVWKELPSDWLDGLDVQKQVASPIYDSDVNKWHVKCGNELSEWEEKGWITSIDPYGWFQWYCRFYQGRRSSDDERQVSRGLGVMVS